MNHTMRYTILTAGFATMSFGQLVIPSGTKVTCRLEQSISSSTAQEGQGVNLAVTEDVRINEVVVIKQGATVYGTVSLAQEKRRMGRSGKLDFTIDKVRGADGEFIPIRYTPYKKAGEGRGVTSGVLTAGAAVVFWPAAPLFLLMKGKDVTINRGVTVDVFTDADHTMKNPAYMQAPSIVSMQRGAGAAPLAEPVANPFLNAGAAETGILTIDSDVEGAEVEIDGAFVGNTPSTRRLTVGTHSVLVREGDRVWERKISVQPGDAVRLRARVGVAPTTSPTPASTRAAVKR
jgi:hypothetical protein